jgi:hypothetical protein
VRPSDICRRIAAAGIGPVDLDEIQGLARYVDQLEIAMAQAVTVRHVRKAVQQGVPFRVFEKPRLRDVRRQLQL